MSPSGCGTEQNGKDAAPLSDVSVSSSLAAICKTEGENSKLLATNQFALAVSSVVFVCVARCFSFACFWCVLSRDVDL